MATLANKKNGHRVLKWTAPDGKPKWVYLGKMPRKIAEGVRRHVEDILAAQRAGQPAPGASAAWLAEIGDDLHAKLSEKGLVPERPKVGDRRLDRMCDNYVARRTDLKHRTRENLRQCKRVLVGFFGASRDYTTINRGEAKDWRRSLAAQGLSGPTISTHVKKARQFWDDAVDRGAVTENPFRSIKAGSQANEGRNRYVPESDVRKVLGACPDAEWRLIFVLARWGGLRVPSETKRLKWEHVRWETGRLTVTSPKTERYEGKGSRDIPLFPELAEALRECWELAEEGTGHVIARHRGVNIGTLAVKIVKRAGLEPWPRIFQNLRASRQTDLAETYPIHVCCGWIGNTEVVARKHYLVIHEDHFARARGEAAEAEPGGRGATPGATGVSGSERKGATVPTKKPPQGPIPGSCAGVIYPQGGSNLGGGGRGSDALSLKAPPIALPPHLFWWRGRLIPRRRRPTPLYDRRRRETRALVDRYLKAAAAERAAAGLPGPVTPNAPTSFKEDEPCNP